MPSMDQQVRIRGTRGNPEITRKEADRIHEEARRRSVELKDLSFASEAYLPEGWMGMVRLAPPPLADFARVEASQCRYHLDHDWSKPVGHADVDHEARPASTGARSGNVYRCNVTVPEIDATATKDYLAQREGGLRGDVSVGYNIDRGCILVEIGHDLGRRQVRCRLGAAGGLGRHGAGRRVGGGSAQRAVSEVRWPPRVGPPA